MTNPILRASQFVADQGTPTERRGEHHMYWCPGCDALHSVVIRPAVNGVGAGWTFDGNYESPTYSPSQLTRFKQNGQDVVCHTFINNGHIQYLTDCTHALAGQTVPMVPLPDWVVSFDDED